MQIECNMHSPVFISALPHCQSSAPLKKMLAEVSKHCGVQWIGGRESPNIGMEEFYTPHARFPVFGWYSPLPVVHCSSIRHNPDLLEILFWRSRRLQEGRRKGSSVALVQPKILNSNYSFLTPFPFFPPRMLLLTCQNGRMDTSTLPNTMIKWCLQ